MLKHEKLRYQILRKFYSQADFAIAIGSHAPVVSDILHGRKTLDSETGKRWAEALGCKIDDLGPVIDYSKRPICRCEQP